MLSKEECFVGKENTGGKDLRQGKDLLLHLLTSKRPTGFSYIGREKLIQNVKNTIIHDEKVYRIIQKISAHHGKPMTYSDVYRKRSYQGLPLIATMDKNVLSRIVKDVEEEMKDFKIDLY